MKKAILAILTGLIFVLPCWADNADLSPQEAYGRIFSSDEKQVEQYFAREFLNVIPAAKIIEIKQIYVDALGKYKEARSADNGYRLIFEKGEADSKIKIDADNKISTLWFGAPEFTSDTFEAVTSELKKLAGEISVCLERRDPLKADKEEILIINPDKPLGCGSAFKLYLLKALDDSIKKGERAWADVVELREDWRSFPSGLLQEWPAGSRHTLETLAGLMISLSDNTATDHIYNLIGVDKLRGYFPASCVDLYNTSQVLKLKFFFPADAQKYLKADAAGKKAVLAAMDAIKPSEIASLSAIYQLNEPILVEEIEWFISTRNLCDVIYSLRDNHLIRINPATGLVNKKDWHIAGFKGGSEPGVLNYTWLLQKTPKSPFYTLSCTIINTQKAVDSDKFDILVSRLLKLVSAL
ncbi:MAG: hypothetical protein CVV42_01795 [Candidatus Riflebacteria bacterium HGW-Riflebacteria-2]|jgi:hypothetical protein|nr:MAG: hypothetical protein CVV42_01795 [Candidatus Riflebacteria bacterium HGW-Riflebacteria-2]